MIAFGIIMKRWVNLKTSVGSRKAVECSRHKLHFLLPWRSSTQALGAPVKTEKALITNKVTENCFCISTFHGGYHAFFCFTMHTKVMYMDVLNAAIDGSRELPYVSFPRPTEVFRLKRLLEPSYSAIPNRSQWSGDCMFRIYVLFALLFAILPASVASAAEVTLKLQHFLDSDSFPHQALIEPWARQIEKDSHGRIKVEIYPAMTLGGKAPELVDQVTKGDVDIIWTAAAYTPGRFPRSEVFTLPLVHGGNPVATNLAMMQELDAGLAADFRDLHPLLLHVQAGHALHLSGKPVTRLEDFNGLELRPAGRGIGKALVEVLGAVPTGKRHPKLEKALANHRLDGAFMSFQLADSMGVIDAASSHTQLEGDRYFGTSLYPVSLHI